MHTVYRILVGCALITAVALISDRSRALAGIAATMPINITIILWIIWGKSEREYSNIQEVSRSMLTGIFSTACFIALCWFGFNRRWSFVMTLTVGYLVWAAIVFGPALLRRLVERS